MSRISPATLATAIARVRAMDLAQKERLGDELFRAQPHFLASFLVQRKFGVSLAKCEFLLDVMLICFQAMKESGVNWPLITEDEQERQMRRLTATIKFGTDLHGDLRSQALKQYLDAHPEKALLAFVQAETAMWLERVEPKESDKYGGDGCVESRALHCLRPAAGIASRAGLQTPGSNERRAGSRELVNIHRHRTNRMSFAVNESPNFIGRLSGKSRFPATHAHMCGNVFDQDAAGIDREHFAHETPPCRSCATDVALEHAYLRLR